MESYFFDIRRQLFEYDQVLNTQRDRVYGERRRALESDDLSAQMIEYAERTVDDILEVSFPSVHPSVSSSRLEIRMKDVRCRNMPQNLLKVWRTLTRSAWSE